MTDNQLPVDDLERLESQIAVLQETKEEIEGRQQRLKRELDELYVQLMSEFGHRWSPLVKTGYV